MPDRSSSASTCTVEDHTIHQLLEGRPLPSPQPRLDVGDDAAVLADGTVVTADLLIESVHFDDRLSPADLGWKAVMVNASDISAMGAHPRWLTLSLSLPSVEPVWILSFREGLHAACARVGARLIGGDTTRSPGPRVISITMGGELGSSGRFIPRSGAQAGDLLGVTGHLGGAAAGFFGIPAGLSSLRRPEPPLPLGPRLATIAGVHAMMDLSDGLSVDLPRLCRASQVGARLDPTQIPLHDALSTDPLALERALGFGEDYQLLVAAAPDAKSAVEQEAASLGIRFTWIGQCTAESNLLLAEVPLPAGLWAHFQNSAPC